MITALPLKQLLWLVTIFLLIATAIVIVPTYCQGDFAAVAVKIQQEPIALLSKIVGVAALLSSVIGWHPIIDHIWKRVRLLNYLVAPNLNGVYEFKTFSNWEIQKAMRAAMNKEAIPEQDALKIPTYDVVGTLTVKMGLWRLSMTYVPKTQSESPSNSTTVAASLQFNQKQNRFELQYVFEGTVIPPGAGTDTDYLGSAHLEIPRSCKAPDRMQGYYWTNRSWRLGLNTAGLVVVERKNLQ